MAPGLPVAAMVRARHGAGPLVGVCAAHRRYRGRVVPEKNKRKTHVRSPAPKPWGTISKPRWYPQPPGLSGTLSPAGREPLAVSVLRGPRGVLTWLPNSLAGSGVLDLTGSYWVDSAKAKGCKASQNRWRQMDAKRYHPVCTGWVIMFILGM